MKGEIDKLRELDSSVDRGGIHGIYAWEKHPEYPKYIFDNKKTDLENIKIYLLLHYKMNIDEYKLCKKRGLDRNMSIHSNNIHQIETMLIELFFG